MNMPLTQLPGHPNVPWGNQMAALPDFRSAMTSARSQITPFNTVVAAALIYTGYRLLKAGKEGHRRVSRRVKKYSYVRSAKRAAARAAASHFDQEFK